MEDNPYSAFVGTMREESERTRPAAFRVGTVITETPLEIDIGGAVQRGNALIFASSSPYVDVDIDETELRYDDTDTTIEHTLEIEPHDHKGITESHTHDADGEETSATTLQYDTLPETLSFTHTVKPHNHIGITTRHSHSARVSDRIPKFKKGTKLLMIPYEDEQRYIVLARLVGL